MNQEVLIGPGSGQVQPTDRITELHTVDNGLFMYVLAEPRDGSKWELTLIIHIMMLMEPALSEALLKAELFSVYGLGPQGDIIRINNYVRLVRGGSTIGIKNQGSTTPSSYTLNQNYPNPFNPTTNIEFSIPKSGNVSLIIYNILGKEVATLYNGFLNAGSYTEQFDGSNLSSSVYFYRLTAGDFISTKRMVLMK